MGRRIVLFLAFLLASPPAFASEGGQASEPRNRVGLSLLGGWCDELGGLTPTIPGYPSDQLAPFETEGLGIEGSWFRLLRRGKTWRSWAGLELWGIDFENRAQSSVVDVFSGRSTSVRFEAVLGAIDGGGRWVRGSGRLRLVLGAGAGLYLLRVQEHLEDFGYADTGYDDRGPGGYVLTGVEYGLRAPFLLRLDAKVHVFDLGDAGGLFTAESLRGSLAEIVLGADWQSGAPR